MFKCYFRIVEVVNVIALTYILTNSLNFIELCMYVCMTREFVIVQSKAAAPKETTIFTFNNRMLVII